MSIKINIQKTLLILIISTPFIISQCSGYTESDPLTSNCETCSFFSKVDDTSTGTGCLCPIGIGKTVNSSNNQCVDCSIISLVNQSGNCKSQCDPGFEVNGSNCQGCYLSSKIWNGSSCVSCSGGYEFDTNTNSCKTCKALGKFEQSSKCEPACFQFYKGDGSNICKLCSVYSQVWDSSLSQCVDCPVYTIYSSTTTDCKNCIDLGLFIESTVCVSACSTGRKVDVSDNTCKLCSFFNQIPSGSTCIDCPIGKTYDSVSNSCITCSQANIYEENGVCKSSCSDGYKENGSKICYLCSFYQQIWDSTLRICSNCGSGLKFDTVSSTCKPCSFFTLNNQAGTCQSNCDINYDILPTDTNRLCKYCWEIGKVNQTGLCLSTCNSHYDYSVNDTTKICKLCVDIGKVDSNGSCIDSCPNTYLPDQLDSNKCKTCLFFNKVILNNQCADNCGVSTGLKLDTSDNTCKKCIIFNLVDQDGNCQASCNQNQGPDSLKICTLCINLNPNKYDQEGICQPICNSTWITDPFFICVKCKYQFGVCKWKCDAGYLHDSAYICKLCDELNLVNMNGVCQVSCDIGYQPDPITGICFKCAYQNGVCQSNCDPGYSRDPLNICLLCKALSLVNQNNNCQSQCNTGYSPDQQSNCKQCKEIGLVDDNGVCLLDCVTSGTAPNSNSICVTCYTQGSDCVAECSPGNILQGQSCVSCLSAGMVNQDTNCQVTCNYGYQASSGICLACNTYNLIVNHDGSCVSSCPNGYINSSNVCIKCFMQGSICKFQCDPSYIPDTNNNCVTCITKGLYDMNGLCVSDCDSGYYPNPNNGLCETCFQSGKFNLNGECLDSCPFGYSTFGENLCVQCKVIGKYDLNGNCIDQCIEGTLPDSNNICICSGGFKLDSYNICRKCSYLNLKDQNGVCQDSCDLGYIADSNGICVLCQAQSLKDQNGVCQEVCNNGYKTQTGSYICKTCLVLGLYDQNGTCKSQCDNLYTSNSNNICVPCVIQDNICQSSCNSGYSPLNGVCKKCLDLSQFESNGNCVYICPYGQDVNSINVCVDCKVLGKYNQDGYCKPSCNTNFIGDANNICVQCKLQNSVCVLTCNSGYMDNGTQTCIKCSVGGMVDQAGKCQVTCDGNYKVDSNSICQTCKYYGEYGQFGVCRKKCGYGYISDTNNICKSCVEVGLVNQSGACISTCNTGYQANTDGICIPCLTENSVCVLKCSLGYTSNDSLVCVQCNVIGLFNQDNKCQDKCNVNYTPNSNGLCVLCKDNNMVNQDGTCQNQCNSNYISQTLTGICVLCIDNDMVNQDGECLLECRHSFKADANSICKLCQVLSLVNQNGVCQMKCDADYIADGMSICQLCTSVGMISYNGVCVNSCPKGFINSSLFNKCVTCLVDNKVDQDGVCIDNCLDRYTLNSNNKCVLCKEVSKYEQNLQCVSNCDPGSIADSNNLCQKCIDIGLVSYQGNCINSCPNETMNDGTGVCKSCLLLNKVIQGGFCKDSCDSGYSIDINTNKCELCLFFNKVNQLGNCQNICNTNFYPDSDLICRSCYESGKYMQGSICLNECSTGYISNSSRVCETCSAAGFFTYDSVCVIQCPQGFVPLTSNCVDCVVGGMKKLNGSCLSSCPSNYMSNPSGDCVSCQTLNLFNNGGNCVSNCPTGTVSDEQGYCKTCIQAGMYSYGTTCLPSCPNGYYPVSNICTNMTGKFIYNGTLVSVCPSGYSSDSLNFCLTCAQLGKYDSSGSCISPCPSNFYTDETNKKCIDYMTLQQYIFNNQLVSNCPSHTISTTNNICQLCSIANKFDFNGVCLSACPSNTYTNTSNKTCFDYKANGKYLYNTSIVDICPDGYESNSLNICISCFSQGKYTSLGKCVSLCPSKFFTDIPNLECIDYISENKYLYNNSIVDICPDGFTSIQDHICITCIAANQWKLNGKCTLDDCPSTYFPDIPTMTCIDYVSQGLFLYNNSLVPVCPSKYTSKPGNVCVLCKEKLLYDSNGNCVDDCPSSVFKDTTNLLCIDYLANGDYLYNNQVVDSCPAGFSSDVTHICQLCIVFGKYNSKGNCVDACSPIEFVSVDDKICIDFKSEGKYLYNNQIVDKCPEDKASDSNNICVDCSEAGYFTYNNICILTCPTNTFSGENIKECFNCKIDEVFYNDNCHTECLEGYVPNNQLCLKCNEKIYKKECISECPQYSIFNENSRLCIRCIDNNKGFYNNSCVDICPSGVDYEMYIDKENGLCTKKTSCSPNPCLNNGTCVILNDSFKCNCTLDVFGSTCDQIGLISLKNNLDEKLNNLINNSNFNQTLSINESSIVSNLTSDLQKINDLVDKDFTDKFYNFINGKLQGMILGQIVPLDGSLFSSLSDLKKVLELDLNKYSQLNDSNRTTVIQKEITRLDKDILDLNLLLIKNNITLNNTNTTTNKFEIINSVPTPEDITRSSQYNTSLFNLSECEVLLKKENLINLNDKLKIMKIDNSVSINISNTTSNQLPYTGYQSSVVYKIVKELNNSYIDIDTTICEKNKIKMNIFLPFDKRQFSIDLNNLLDFREEGHDLLNKNDDFFNDACQNYIDKYYNLDTTRKYRRDKYFQNKTISCNSTITNENQCYLKDIIRLGLINCECNFQSNISQVYVNIKSDYFSQDPGENIQIATCIERLFNPFDILNPGIYTVIGIGLLNIIYFSINYLFLSKKFITKNIKNLFMNDFANQHHVNQQIELPLRSGIPNPTPDEEDKNKNKIEKPIEEELKVKFESPFKLKSNGETPFDSHKRFNKKMFESSNKGRRRKIEEMNEEDEDESIKKGFDLDLKRLDVEGKENDDINDKETVYNLDIPNASKKVSPVKLRKVKMIENANKHKEEFDKYLPFNISNIDFSKKHLMENKILQEEEIKQNEKDFNNLISNDNLILKENEIQSHINKTFSKKVFDIDAIFDDDNETKNIDILNNDSKDKDNKKFINNYIMKEDNIINNKIENIIDISDRPQSSLNLIQILKIKSNQLLFRDYSYMKGVEKITRDDRKSFQFFCDIMKSNHFVLNLFMFKSIINPLMMRIIYFSISFNLLFLGNCILFLDEYITIRLSLYSNISEIEFSLKYLLNKSMYSLGFSILGRNIICFIINIPNNISELLNLAYSEKDIDKLKEAKIKFDKKLKLRYIILISVYFIISLITIYYTTIFFNIYYTTRLLTIISFFFSLFIDVFIIGMIFPFLLTLVWIISKKCKGGMIFLYDFFNMFRII